MQLGYNYGNLERPSMIELRFFYIHLYKPITKNITPQFDPLGEKVLFFYFLLLKYKYLSPRIHLESSWSSQEKKS